MKKISIFTALLTMTVLLFSCKQAQDIKAFTEANYSLQGVEDVKLNGIDLEDRLQTKRNLSYNEQDSLLNAITNNSLQVSAVMALYVDLQDQTEERALTLTKLKWLLLVNGEEALTGTINRDIVLQDGLNTVPFNTPVQLTENDGQPNYTGLSRLITLIGQQRDIRQHVTFQIKPTVQTPVGNIESPSFITVMKPAEVAVSNGETQ
ncbi:hypothetical protein ACFSKU_19125 [Pontibacter silvestris]|uniref:Lipoprotein n=1 Tax=Pontibacter silvestris TaxID=2305183 RepID=A0ABW4X1Z8_9BACT|nr:hypothetical protein [Pontibacter silvestris]MCC9134996.1 hypothetical protein [Pontibacter silvestris]